MGIAVLAASYSVLFFWPRTVVFSYNDETCITAPVLLPDLVSQNQGDAFSAALTESFSIAGYPLYSHTTCVTPVHTPAEHSEDTIRVGAAFLAKRIHVTAGAFPSLSIGDMLEAAIPAHEPLKLKLNGADRIFDYRLYANGNMTDCAKHEHELTCDVAALELEQSETYDVAFKRLFNGAVAETIFERSLNTVDSVRVADTSIDDGQVIYDAPDVFTLTMNRAVAAASASLHLVDGDQRENIAITVTADEQTVTIAFDEPLDRQASFVFAVEDVRAADGGFLTRPFTLPFETSGGPQVQSTNVGSNQVPPGGDIVLTFDSAVSPDQNLAALVQLEADSNRVSADLHTHGNTVIISPENPLPNCAPLTVRVLDGLQNEHGISGGSAWQTNSRVLCQSVSTIGTSVQGRDIIAHSFGNGASAILFVGGIHGNEQSSVHTLEQWISELENNPEHIPEHRRVVVIPNASPDGYIAGSRNNANNVDLNRNFPTHDWQSAVTFGDGAHNPTGGGTAPLSEPESKALADYTLSLNPRLVLTYHSIAGYVIPNDAGDSDNLAQSYAQASDLRYASHAQTDDIFHYDTTGAYEDWLHDRHGVPALLLELWTRAGNEFADNRNAMWRMVEL